MRYPELGVINPTSVRTDGGETIAVDEVLELLSDERRRYVLYELRDRAHIELETLATIVVARETDVSIGDVSSDQATQTAISLHHKELPMLHEARLVDYDHRHGDVRSGVEFSLVEKYLQLTAEDDGIQ